MSLEATITITVPPQSPSIFSTLLQFILLLLNWLLFKSDGTHLRIFIPGKSWGQYLEEMSQSGTWGDNLMLMGAADFLQAEIEVLSTMSPVPLSIKPRTRTGHRSSAPPLIFGRVSLCQSCEEG